MKKREKGRERRGGIWKRDGQPALGGAAWSWGGGPGKDKSFLTFLSREIQQGIASSGSLIRSTCYFEVTLITTESSKLHNL